METFDAVIIGAGAAGLMCALTAGQRGRRVVLIDHLEQAGAKILISGGGRCNFTNLEVTPERFLSANPAFCRSALSRYSQHDFIAMVERHRIPYHHKTLGQLFCDGSARAIVAMLLRECAAAKVALRLGQQVSAVSRADQFQITTDRGRFAAPILVIATGGLSLAKLGATGFAYDLAGRFGMPVIEPRPGLVPLRFDDGTGALCRSLTGVSVDALVACERDRFREKILFTHRGLSGPAILQISSYWRAGRALTVDLCPDQELFDFLQQRKRERPRAELKNILAELLPARLAHTLAPAGPTPIANWPDRALAQIAARLTRWELQPTGTEGWPKAEVTAGGIDTTALSSRTMEVRNVPGLYFIGEAVDVTGWLGGYNFQWAWSSGWCAGQEL